MAGIVMGSMSALFFMIFAGVAYCQREAIYTHKELLDDSGDTKIVDECPDKAFTGVHGAAVSRREAASPSTKFSGMNNEQLNVHLVQSPKPSTGLPTNQSANDVGQPNSTKTELPPDETANVGGQPDSTKTELLPNETMLTASRPTRAGMFLPPHEPKLPRHNGAASQRDILSARMPANEDDLQSHTSKPVRMYKTLLDARDGDHREVFHL